MHVRKRNGRLEPVNLTKIIASLERYCGDLPGVDVYRIATKTVGGLIDGVSTRELDMFSVRTAKDLIIDDPVYSRVAARILANLIQKEVSGQDIQSFSQSIEAGYAQGLIAPDTHALVMANKRKLNNTVKHERDWNMEYHGLQTVYDRYLLKHRTLVASEDGGRKQRAVIETPQYFLLRVACGLANEASEAIELYNLLSSLEYMCSTPTLFNAGTTHSQMSSCYLLDSPIDSLDDIYKRYADIAMLSKFAGGIGVSLSRLRGKGSLIKGTNGNSNGLVPWAHTLSGSVGSVNQGGKRKGAACIYLETHHPDLLQFLELKDNTGEKEERAYNLNLANWVSDLFMKRVKEDGEWSFFDATVAPELNDLYGDAYEARYLQLEAEERYTEQMPARKVYSRMMRTLAETGNGWMCFKDICNRRGNQVNDRLGTMIHLSNLCTEVIEVTSSGKRELVSREGMVGLSGTDLLEQNLRVVGFDTHRDGFEVIRGSETAVCLAEGTQVLTSEGYRPIEQCNDADVYVPFANDEDFTRTHRFVKATLIDNGVRDCLSISLSNGKRLSATANHRFLKRIDRNRYTKQDTYDWVTADDISRGDLIVLARNDAIHDNLHYDPSFAALGWMIGDGWCLEDGTVGLCFAPEKMEAQSAVMSVMKEWHQSLPIAVGGHNDVFPSGYTQPNGVVNWMTQKRSFFAMMQDRFGMKPAKSPQKEVPSSVIAGSPSQKSSFLAGLFSADGSIIKRKGKPVGISLSSASKIMLEQVQVLLAEFGVHTGLTWFFVKERGRWQGSLRAEEVRSIEAFHTNIGFRLHSSKQTELEVALSKRTAEKGCVKVLSVEPAGCHQVYDLYVPGAHHFVAEGVITHNCNLGSINVGRGYVKHGKLDKEKLRKNVAIAVKYLDRVIDRNYYPIHEAEASNLRWRPVGLGLMGVADLFFQLRLPYESEEAIKLSGEIQEEIYYQALRTSCDLAKTLGAHRDFHLTRAAQGHLQFDLAGATPSDPERWEVLRQDIIQNGLRNSLLIAIAPTATISHICGTEECIEPIKSNLLKRETLSGEFISINKYLVDDLRKIGRWNAETITQLKINEGSIATIPDLPGEMYDLYKTVWEMSMKSIIAHGVARGAYIDQSHSLNMFIDLNRYPEDRRIGVLSSLYMHAWEQGLKTTYYFRSRAATRIEQTTTRMAAPILQMAEETPEICESCQ